MLIENLTQVLESNTVADVHIPCSTVAELPLAVRIWVDHHSDSPSFYN